MKEGKFVYVGLSTFAIKCGQINLIIEFLQHISIEFSLNCTKLATLPAKAYAGGGGGVQIS